MLSNEYLIITTLRTGCAPKVDMAIISLKYYIHSGSGSDTVVELAERDTALKLFRSSTASKPNSRRLDLCLASGHSWVWTSD